jgi:SagB-type dehydrogenase family enzyme
MNYEALLKARRDFLKSHDWDLIPPSPEWEPDQRKGVLAPSIEKLIPANSETVPLTPYHELDFRAVSLQEAINSRRSRRNYGDQAVSRDELSFLLWATQGVHRINDDRSLSWRTAPSGGNRHPFETHLIVNNVEGIRRGVHRYLALSHSLLYLHGVNGDFNKVITDACAGQAFASKAAVIFAWTTIPYRAEWRYSLLAHMDIAIEAGHICQNLYLACEAIKAATCALTGYEQKLVDDIIGVDGEDEYTVYLAPVGKIPTKHST